MDNQNSVLKLRDYPTGLWITGIFLLTGGVYVYITMPSNLIFSIPLALAGSVFLLTGTTLTVTADRIGQMLTLSYRALLWGSKKEIPLGEIAAIQLEMSRNHSSSRSSGPSYRIVVVRKDGQVVPFRSYYSSGTGGKRKKVQQLREFLGVGGTDETIGGLFNLAQQMAQQAYQKQQETLTGPAAEEHVTDGVHWTVQTVSFGASAVTRWFSTDFQCPGGFLFLSQKVAGQKTMAGGLMGGVARMLYQQSLGLYGFGGEDTPGLDNANLLEPLDANLEPHYSAFTSDPQAARQVLNPWAAAPLADWASRYPLQQVQLQRGLFGQLVVLFSPRGIYIACAGTMIPEAVEELTNLGVALVKAEGGGSKT